MLFSVKLPKYFLDEALLIAFYLINRSFTHALDDDILEKIWNGRNVKCTHLRVFGCKEQRSKLNAKVMKCIFISYRNNKFGYTLSDTKNKKVI